MLTALQSYSQSDTQDLRPVTFPFWIAQEMAVDLEEKDRLELVNTELQTAIANLKEQMAKSLLLVSAKEDQIAIKDQFIKILETQYEAEKAKKPKSNWFVWALATIAAFGTGFVIGVL